MADLDRYIPLVEFLGRALGPRTEVVLHDLDDKERSVVAIANGHISGRTVGSPVTDFVLRRMQEGVDAGTVYEAGYRGMSASGRTLRSSSYFLRGEDGDIQGMLCINVDVTVVEQLHSVLSAELSGMMQPPALVAADQQSSPEAVKPVVSDARASNGATESFRGTVEELLESLLNAAIAEVGVAPEAMSVKDRIDVIEVLSERGLFLLKGGVAAAAERLEVSEPTVYRYLNRVRNASKKVS